MATTHPLREPASRLPFKTHGNLLDLKTLRANIATLQAHAMVKRGRRSTLDEEMDSELKLLYMQLNGPPKENKRARRNTLDDDLELLYRQFNGLPEEKKKKGGREKDGDQETSNETKNATGVENDPVVEHSYEIPRDGKSRGLYNPGQLCYRNATLQVLLHQPAFIAMLQAIHTDDCKKPWQECVPHILREFGRCYWRSDMPDETLTRGLEALNAALIKTIPRDDKADGKRGFGAELHDGAQSDAWEFLMYCIQEPLRGGKVLSRKNDTRPGSEMVAQVFDTRFKTIWHCLYCGLEHTISDWEPESHLELKITKPTTGLSLAAYIDHAMVDELPLECNCARAEQDYATLGSWPVRERRKQIASSPEVLTIHLDRSDSEEVEVKLDAAGNVVNEDVPELKVENHVPCEEFLDLKAYTAGGGELRYRLDGVVSHAGSSLRSGHYVAWVRSADGASFSRISDSDVSKAGLDDLLNCRGDSSYLLVYSKVEEAM